MVVPPRWGARVGYRQYYDPILSIKDGVFSLVHIEPNNLLRLQSKKAGTHKWISALKVKRL